MKYIYGLLVILIIVFASIILINGKKNNANTGSIPSTTLSVDNNIRKVGKIPQYMPLKVKFKLKNTGSQPLLIYSVTADCNCTVPAWDNSNVLPNKEKIITVTYNAKNVGFFQKKVIVKSNNKSGDVILLIIGHVL